MKNNIIQNKVRNQEQVTNEEKKRKAGMKKEGK